jgi:hypothetical protein
MQAALIVLGLLHLRQIENVDFLPPVILAFVEPGLQRVDLVRIGRRVDLADLVEGLERRRDILRLVLEVEHEGVVLAGAGAVEARQGLHRLDAREPLVDVHGVQERLVEAGLVLVGDEEHLVLVGLKGGGQAGL